MVDSFEDLVIDRCGHAWRLVAPLWREGEGAHTGSFNLIKHGSTPHNSIAGKQSDRCAAAPQHLVHLGLELSAPCIDVYPPSNPGRGRHAIRLQYIHKDLAVCRARRSAPVREWERGGRGGVGAPAPPCNSPAALVGAPSNPAVGLSGIKFTWQLLLSLDSSLPSLCATSGVSFCPAADTHTPLSRCSDKTK